MASSVALSGAAEVLPLLVTLATVAVTRSVVSTSLTVRVPVVPSPALVSVKPAVSGPSVMSGASLLPVMVTVTV